MGGGIKEMKRRNSMERSRNCNAAFLIIFCSWQVHWIRYRQGSGPWYVVPFVISSLIFYLIRNFPADNCDNCRERHVSCICQYLMDFNMPWNIHRSVKINCLRQFSSSLAWLVYRLFQMNNSHEISGIDGRKEKWIYFHIV